jgi:hypothetical protein
MSGRISLAFAVLAGLASSSCNDTTCGAGTVRQQMKDGSTQCVPVSATPGNTKCDPDAGVMLFGGDQCVSIIQCGAGTTLDVATNTCVPSAGAGPHTPDVCPTPTPGNLCVNGTVLHFVDHSFLSGEMVRVALYEPLAFLNDPTSMPIAETLTGDTFVFKDVQAPATGLVALAVTGPGGVTTTYQLTGVATQIVPGQTYRLDAFAMMVSDVAAWTTSSGVDYDAKGAYVGVFYQDKPASPNQLPANETMPVAGAKMVQAGSMTSPAGTQYFSTDLKTISQSATMTSAIGAAIMPAPANLDTFTGQGGGVTTWESVTGASLPHAVFIQRFHPTP